MLKKTNAWLWVPTLSFASGLPYHAITSASDIMYMDMGVDNKTIALCTSLLLIPWTIKPLWSPFVEMISTRRKWTLYSQLLLAVCFTAIAMAVNSESFFFLTLVAFMIGAFVSSTHDIALDGFYILALTQEKQSFFSGIRNTFYRIAIVFSSGFLVILAARLSSWLGMLGEYATELELTSLANTLEHLSVIFKQKPYAWSATFAVTATIMVILYIYHSRILPKPEKDESRTPGNIYGFFNNFIEIIATYFRKPGIWATLLFLLLFRFPEAQLGKIGKLFLMDSIEAGGLGLDKGDIGLINGVVGIIGLIIGGIAGGICISRKGMKYWLWPMVFAISLPDAVYVYMSMAMPGNLYTIGSCVFIEQLGYGFGFTAYTLYMIYFAQGKYPTAHFAISTAFMSLGMMLPGMISGYIQEWVGYENFFIWVMACTAVTFAVSALIKIDPNFGKK